MVSIVTNNLDKAYLMNNVFQTGYAYYKDSSSHAFEKAEKCNVIFQAANLGAIFWATLQGCYILFENEYIASLLHSMNTFITQNPEWADPLVSSLLTCTLLSAASWCFLIAKGVNIINDQTKPSSIEVGVPEEADNIAISWGSPNSKTFSQGLHLTQLIFSVALTAFSSTPYFYALSACMHAYALYKTTNKNWVNIEMTFPEQELGTDPDPRVAKTVVSYYVPNLLAAKPSLVDEQGQDCSICLDNNKGPSVIAFHGEHTFHQACLTEWVRRVKERILNGFHRIKYIDPDTRKTTGYRLILNSENCASCPNCRVKPSFITNNIEAIIEEVDGRSFPVNIIFGAASQG